MEAQEAAHTGSQVSEARAEFVSSIGRRLSALRTALRELEAEPRAAARRDVVLRRLHALGAASRVLGFEAAAETLNTAENSLYRSAATGEVLMRDLAEVLRAIDQVPALVWGGTPEKTPASGMETSSEAHPVHAVAFVDRALGCALDDNREHAKFDHDVAGDAPRAIDLVRATGPDVVVVDIDLEGASDLVDALLTDELVEPFALVVVGTLQAAEAAATFVARGAKRVLPKPVSPDTMERAVLAVARRGHEHTAAHEAVGDITVEELAARISAEVRRGLVDAQLPGNPIAPVPFGEGVDVLAAVWSAVARVREIATMRSGGSLRFEATGPEGAIPLAPWTSADRRAGERSARGARANDGVRLEGRLAVVADDDPSVVWFLSGLLKTAGVEVLEAHDGRRALDLTLTRWPDLVVSDVLMPRMDGFSLCRAIKRDVAVRDVPVVLLSWKEDLLQRLRELGADADAYLRKEAAGTTVLERIREVLRPRARVEARMVTGGVVRGRLDGLTPRLVLELACARHRDCRVSFRDSVYLYEVDVRGGHPVQATRTSTDGSFSRGEKVVSALLGIGAGRFSIAPDSAPCRDDLNRPLSELLVPHITRARRAQDVVVGGLDRIDSIVIDAEAISAYLAATPDPALRLLQRLSAGTSPAEIIREPTTDRQALESVLLDIARRGAILDLTVSGRAIDLDAPLDEAEPEAEASAPPQFTLELSPAAGEASARPPSTELSPQWPMDPNVTPGVNFQQHATGFRDEAGTFPGVGPDGSPARTATEPKPGATGSAAPPAKSTGSEVPAAEGKPASAPPAASVAEPDSAEVDESWAPGEVASKGSAQPPESAEEASSKEAAAAPIEPATQVPRPEPSPKAPEAFPKVKEVRLPTPLRSTAEESESSSAPAESPSAPAAASESAPTDAESEQPGEALESKEAAVAAKQPEVAESEAAAEASADDEEAVADSPAAEVSAKPEPTAEADGEEPAEEAPAKKKRAPETQRSLTALPKTKAISFPSKAAGRGEATADKTKGQPAQEAAAAAKSEPVEEEKESRLVGFAKVAGVMGVAGVASFLLVTWVRGLGAEAPAPAAEASAPAAPPAVQAVAKAKPMAAGPGVKVESLPLPPGIELAGDKGLLEISITEKDAIYVDDTFVGRGPLKRVPLEPGEHAVKLRKPGEEITHSVKIEAGSRTRLSLEAAK